MRVKINGRIKIEDLNCNLLSIKKINRGKKIRKFQKNFLRMIIFLAIIKENVQKKIALAIKREGNAKNIVGALKHVVLNSLVANASGNVGLLVSVL